VPPPRRSRRLTRQITLVLFASVAIIVLAMLGRDNFRRYQCRKSLEYYARLLQKAGFDPEHAALNWLALPAEPKGFLPRSHYEVTNWPLPENIEPDGGTLIAFCASPHKGWILPAGRNLLIWRNGQFIVKWVDETQFAKLGIEPPQ